MSLSAWPVADLRSSLGSFEALFGIGEKPGSDRPRRGVTFPLVTIFCSRATNSLFDPEERRSDSSHSFRRSGTCGSGMAWCPKGSDQSVWAHRRG